MDSEEAERLVLIGSDMDRYEVEVIPRLQKRVSELTVALDGLVKAVDAKRRGRDAALSSEVEAAAYRARGVLDQGGERRADRPGPKAAHELR